VRLAIIFAVIVLICLVVPWHRTSDRGFPPETAALRSIQTIHTAEMQYYSQYGRYAVSLAELGPPAGGLASETAADLIGNDLANGVKQGYRFNIAGNAGGYVVHANPVKYGNKSFYSDQALIIRENKGGRSR